MCGPKLFIYIAIYYSCFEDFRSVRILGPAVIFTFLKKIIHDNRKTERKEYRNITKKKRKK